MNANDSMKFLIDRMGFRFEEAQKFIEKDTEGENIKLLISGYNKGRNDEKKRSEQEWDWASYK
ncbi:hypothetical protein [Jeotgalibacillus terrae]|uniref:UBA domain-containing protein n=1 Tax=Jeotgalibacillus terrae TaxID=587735 RepID=A0ABW5ZH79_9BACL|nr:hypothetical protein [Jeotgalibacillus terrae]MBM7577689.1 hypothetical protein [Jeotgalibacillus terrae]